MKRLLALITVAFLTVSGCKTEERTEESPHERALRVWEDNLEAAERLVAAERKIDDVSVELRRIDAFFSRVTGEGGLLMGHYDESYSVNPQADSRILKLREWCGQNCDRLSVDLESGQVIVLPASESSGDQPSELSADGPSE